MFITASQSMDDNAFRFSIRGSLLGFPFVWSTSDYESVCAILVVTSQFVDHYDEQNLWNSGRGSFMDAC
jgi:hypothetical protein